MVYRNERSVEMGKRIKIHILRLRKKKVEYLDIISCEGGVLVSLKGVGMEKGLGCFENSNAWIQIHKHIHHNFLWIMLLCKFSKNMFLTLINVTPDTDKYYLGVIYR